MTLPHTLKRITLGILLGALAGFVYQKAIGCRTGTCPLTATPRRAMSFGALVGFLFVLNGGSQRSLPGGAPATSTDSSLVQPKGTPWNQTR